MLGVAIGCGPALAVPPQVVRWEILATVVDLEDPLGLFPDVRLGDPVRGLLKYDAALFPNPLFSQPNQHVFTNDAWMDVSRMTIENPRNGSEYEFTTDNHGDYADVTAINDQPFDDGDFDGIHAVQSVVPPEGYQGESPAVTVFLTGPTTVFPRRQSIRRSTTVYRWSWTWTIGHRP